ncbi:MAG: IclR family transcriptional regulator C-terminal domain-containing protein [Devosia sp.]|nr:IclR family transcriptional regulator C-terminal domain-containing protein [Devosia sp.]
MPAAQIEAVRKRIETIRSRGYEAIDAEQLKGITDLTFPILDAAGVARAALTIPYLTAMPYYLTASDDSIGLDQAAALLYHAAAEITAMMGGTLSQPSFPLALE